MSGAGEKARFPLLAKVFSAVMLLVIGYTLGVVSHHSVVTSTPKMRVAAARLPRLLEQHPPACSAAIVPIRMVCIYLPKRFAFIKKQLDTLAAQAEGSLAVTYLPAVTSMEDERVRGWASNATFQMQKLQYLATMSHTLAMGLAAKEALPTIIIEDDVVVHADFVPVVNAILRGPMVRWSYAVSFGYLVRKPSVRGLLFRGHAKNYIRVLPNRTVIVTDKEGSAGSFGGDMAQPHAFMVGDTDEEDPWGLQSYAVTPAHARALWDDRFREWAESFAEMRIFPVGPQRALRVSPPLVLENFPRFGSSLNHEVTNGEMHANAMAISNFSDYYSDSDEPPEPSPSSWRAVASWLRLFGTDQ